MTWTHQERDRLVAMQPRPLVRHNGLLWTVYDITDDIEDNLVTLQLQNVAAVTVQVPMETCEIVTRPRALPRSVAKRTAFMEVQQLNQRFVIGPKPFILDSDGAGRKLSPAWVSSAPLCFWPAGFYKETVVDLQAYNPAFLYTFSIAGNAVDAYVECHRAMQHLNIRPDILAACGSPASRGVDSWTHTCTMAALGWAYIDQRSGRIEIFDSRVTVTAYEPSRSGGVRIEDKMHWALPAVSDLRPVPVSIGVDLMGLRTTCPAEVASIAFEFSDNPRSPVTEQRRCRAFAALHRPLLTDMQLAILARVSAELTPNAVIQNQFADVENVSTDNETAIKDLYVDEKDDAAKQERLKQVVTWALALNNPDDYPFTALCFVSPSSATRETRCLDALISLPFESLYGVVWEFLVGQTFIGPFSAKQLAGSNSDLFSVEQNFVVVSAAAVQQPNANYVHAYKLDGEPGHVFYNRNKSSSLLVAASRANDVIFASQTSPTKPQWESTSQMLGNFPFLHPSAPMRPATPETARVWKIPLHAKELLELAYGDGTYPNVCAIDLVKNYPEKMASRTSGFLMLDPPLPPQNVLDDLFEHVDQNDSSAVYCAALAAHGPVGVTGLAKNTWTVVYEYYSAMGVPQNAYMQYIAVAYADELLGSVVDVNDRMQDKNTAPSNYIQDKLWNLFNTYVASAVLDLVAGGAATTTSSVAKFVLSCITNETLERVRSASLSAQDGGEDIDFNKEIDVFCKRVNTILVGTIAGAYVISRTNVQTVQWPTTFLRLMFENLDLKSNGIGKYLSMTNSWREMQLSPMRFVVNRASQATVGALEFVGLDRFEFTKQIQEYSKTMTVISPTYEKRGKVDAKWTRRYYSTRNSHITFAANAYDVQSLFLYGRERPRTIDFHSAELLTMCCSHGNAYEFWACAGEKSAVRIKTGPDDLEAATATFIRAFAQAPPPMHQTPPKIMERFAVSAPINATEWSKPERWISVNPALSGFGFIAPMNDAASRAARCKLRHPSGYVASLLATATAKVYAHNEVVLTMWLVSSVNRAGPRFAVNAPVRVGRARPPARHAVPGLFPSRQLMDLYG